MHCLEIQPSPIFQSVYRVCIVTVEFLWPLAILVYCYGRILRVIRARIGSKMGSEDAQTVKFELARNNVIKTLFIVAFFFVICYMGNELFDLFFYLGFEVDWNGGYYQFVVSVLFLNCTINPFIYHINYKDFQKALMRQFCCRISQSIGNSNPITTISSSLENKSQAREAWMALSISHLLVKTVLLSQKFLQDTIGYFNYYRCTLIIIYEHTCNQIIYIIIILK